MRDEDLSSPCSRCQKCREHVHATYVVLKYAVRKAQDVSVELAFFPPIKVAHSPVRPLGR